MTKMTTGLAVGIGVGPFATKQPEGSSSALDVITSSNGAWWVVKERDGSDNLVDQTGGGRHLTLPGGSANPVLLDHTGTDYFWFPGTAGNNLSIAGLSNSTTYDYTVTYSDTTTNTSSETTDGSGNLVFGNTQANFNLKKVTKIEVEPSGGGALVADVRATSADPDATTFAELISALTVTINRSSSGYKTEVVNQPLYALATDDYLSADDTSNFFDLGSGDSLTAIVVGSFWDTSAAQALIGIGTSISAGWGYRLLTAPSVQVLVNNSFGDIASGSYTGFTWQAFRLDRGSDELEAFRGGVASGSPTDISALTTVTGTSGILSVGSFGGSTSFGNYSIAGVAVTKQALTAAEISDIADALITANGGTP